MYSKESEEVMNNASVGTIPLFGKEYEKQYPPLDLKRKFFTDLLRGDKFSFCCEGNGAGRILLKVSGDSYISLTADVHPLNADPDKDVCRVSSEQSNSPVFVWGAVSPEEYQRVTGPYRSHPEKPPETAS